MTFTNQIEPEEKDASYYRKAYSPNVFEKLSLEEKRSLIDFTVGEFSRDISVAYSDEPSDLIGILTEQDILLINSNMLVKPSKKYSLDLYLFLYKELMTRFVARKKNFVPVSEEGYINKKYREKDYKSSVLDIIILHMLLEELLELNDVISLDNEEREYLSGIIKETSKYLAQMKEKTAPARIDTAEEQAEMSEGNNIGRGKGR